MQPKQSTGVTGVDIGHGVEWVILIPPKLLPCNATWGTPPWLRESATVEKVIGMPREELVYEALLRP